MLYLTDYFRFYIIVIDRLHRLPTLKLQRNGHKPHLSTQLTRLMDLVQPIVPRRRVILLDVLHFLSNRGLSADDVLDVSRCSEPKSCLSTNNCHELQLSITAATATTATTASTDLRAPYISASSHRIYASVSPEIHNGLPHHARSSTGGGAASSLSANGLPTGFSAL